MRAARRVARLAIDEPIDGHLRHPPPGREFAPGDRDHAAGRLIELGLARDVDGFARIARRDQRPHAGVCARQVVDGQRRAEVRVRRVEQVVEILLRGRDVVRRERPLEVVVGRAEQRAPEPRQREDRPPAAGRDDRAAGRERQVFAAQRDVRAAAGPDARDLRLVVQLVGAQPVRPDAGRVDDVRRAHDELAPAGPLAHPHAGGAAGPVADELEHFDAVRADRAEALGLGEHGEHEPRVVGLAVIEEIAGRRRARGERRHELEHLVAGDRAVALGAPVRGIVRWRGRRAPAQAGSGGAPPALDGHDVVEVEPHPGAAIQPLALERRDDERQRMDEMRRQRNEELALEQRLAHEPQIEVLQVAQAAVDELR